MKSHMSATMRPVEALRFKVPTLDESVAHLQQEVRDFVEDNLAGDVVSRGIDCWSERSPDFSRKLGARGWLGMTWPKRYGGHERSAIERYIVTEELLAAAAPVGAHWTADRQTGPLLLRYGTETQRTRFLPGMAAGDVYFCIGMSEPNAGSDLAAVRTAARRVDGGWVLNGQKIWTTGARFSDFMVALCRTSPSEDRHEGLSQLIIDLRSPGISINPIGTMAGTAHFNEVFFQDTFVPAEMLIGEIGQGWSQVMSELAYERSGPERFLSTYPLLIALLDELGPKPSEQAAIRIGELVSQLWTLRRLSLAIAAELDRGGTPAIEAALVKDLGTRFEGSVVDVARELIPPSRRHRDDHFESVLRQSLLTRPTLTLRGGTNEVLRNVVAKGLGVS